MKRELIERELTEVGPKRRGGGGGKRRTVTTNLGESPLTWLHARGHLDDRQFDAGERLRGAQALASSFEKTWEEQRAEALRPRRVSFAPSRPGGA